MIALINKTSRATKSLALFVISLLSFGTFSTASGVQFQSGSSNCRIERETPDNICCIDVRSGIKKCWSRLAAQKFLKESNYPDFTTHIHIKKSTGERYQHTHIKGLRHR